MRHKSYAESGGDGQAAQISTAVDIIQNNVSKPAKVNGANRHLARAGGLQPGKSQVHSTLLSSVPKPDPLYKSHRIVMQGEVADPSNPPSGCYFHPRCRYAQGLCKEKTPEFRQVKPDHWAACHFAEELELMGIEYSN